MSDGGWWRRGAHGNPDTKTGISSIKVIVHKSPFLPCFCFKRCRCSTFLLVYYPLLSPPPLWSHCLELPFYLVLIVWGICAGLSDVCTRFLAFFFTSWFSIPMSAILSSHGRWQVAGPDAYDVCFRITAARYAIGIYQSKCRSAKMLIRGVTWTRYWIDWLTTFLLERCAQLQKD